MNSGAIVLVHFPFSNLRTTKKRPALVLTTVDLADKPALVTVAMITSQVDGIALDGDIRLRDWDAAHLLHPSLVRLAKIATMDVALVQTIIGHLSPRDTATIRTGLRRHLQYWLKKQ